jgi:hypothetical protein
MYDSNWSTELIYRLFYWMKFSNSFTCQQIMNISDEWKENIFERNFVRQTLYGWSLYLNVPLLVVRHSNSTEILLEKTRVTREEGKKLSSFIRDYYLSDSFSHVSTFLFLAPSRFARELNSKIGINLFLGFQTLPFCLCFDLKNKEETRSKGNWIKDEGMLVMATSSFSFLILCIFHLR